MDVTLQQSEVSFQKLTGTFKRSKDINKNVNRLLLTQEKKGSYLKGEQTHRKLTTEHFPLLFRRIKSTYYAANLTIKTCGSLEKRTNRRSQG